MPSPLVNYTPANYGAENDGTLFLSNNLDTCISFHMRFGIAGCLAWAGIISTAEAAPVTFAFEAEIVRIYPSPNVEFANSLDVNIGDLIRGRVTFEPSAPPIDRESLALSFVLHEINLEKTGFDLLVANNDVVVVGSDASEPFDNISISCLTTACDPGRVPGNEALEWTPLLNLFGDHTILDGQYLPSDVSTWNTFTKKELRLTFDPGGFIEAQVGPFSVVPEPPAFAILICSLLVLGFFYKRKRPLGHVGDQ